MSTENNQQSGPPPDKASGEAREAKNGDAVKNEKAEGVFAAARQKIREEAGAAAKAEPLTEAAAEGLQAEIASLKVELAEGRERVLRTLAEMENLRRRTERERIDASKFAITRFARDMLTVADNLDRALGIVTPEAVEKDATLKGFLEGVQLTQREFLNVLERHGVKKVEADGQRFDPNMHQAMMEMENTDVPAGTVIKSFQPAYVIEDRILRPAMVVVSKGGPKPTPKPANDQSSPVGDDRQSSEANSSQGEEPQTRAGSQ